MILYYIFFMEQIKNLDESIKQRQEITDEACAIYQVCVYPCYFPCTRCGNVHLEGNLKETSKTV